MRCPSAKFSLRRGSALREVPLFGILKLLNESYAVNFKYAIS